MLADYVSMFNPRIVGLTGPPAQVHAVADAYKAYYSKVFPEGSATYLMDHTGFIYLMGRSVNTLASFHPAHQPTEWWRSFVSICLRATFFSLSPSPSSQMKPPTTRHIRGSAGLRLVGGMLDLINSMTAPTNHLGFLLRKIMTSAHRP